MVRTIFANIFGRSMKTIAWDMSISRVKANRSEVSCMWQPLNKNWREKYYSAAIALEGNHNLTQFQWKIHIRKHRFFSFVAIIFSLLFLNNYIFMLDLLVNVLLFLENEENSYLESSTMFYFWYRSIVLCPMRSSMVLECAVVRFLAVEAL